MHSHTLTILIFFAFVASNTPLISGRIIGVKDGDTVVFLTVDNTQIVIRLAGVDCPEKSQAFGTKAKQFTSDLIYGKEVKVRTQSIDRYGRTIGTVYLSDGRMLNNELISAGYAWHYEHYSNDTILQRLQIEAKKARRGLWSDPNAVAPWDFRHNDRAVVSGVHAESNERAVEPPCSVVYNTETGKYHVFSCNWALRCSDNCISTPVEDALKRGGTPCKVCCGTP